MTRQNKASALRIGPRDINVLQAVADSLMLSTSQLATLFFPSAKKASGRLKQLVDAGVVVCSRKEWIFSESKTENFYGLTKKGYEELGKVKGSLLTRVTAHPPANVRHLGATNQFGILLKRELGDTDTIEARFVPSWRMLDAIQASGASTPGKGLGRNLVNSIKPDGLLMLRSASGTSLLSFLEIDLDSEPILRRKRNTGSSLMGKLEKYCGYFDSKEYRRDCEPIFDARFRGFRVLLATKSEARLRSLRQQAGKLGDTHFVWGTTFDRVESEGVLGETWQVIVPGDTGTFYALCQAYEHPLSTQSEEQTT